MNWESISKDLSGQKGLVYIMFLGRKTTGEVVAEELKGNNILADPKAQVYNALSFLRKNGYIREIKKENRHKIRTAELTPIIETHKRLNKPFGVVEQELIKTVGQYMEYFPNLVKQILEIWKYNIRNLPWEFLFDKLYSRYSVYFPIKTFEDTVYTYMKRDTEGREDLSDLLKLVWGMYISATRDNMKRVFEATDYLQKVYKKTTKEDRLVFLNYAIKQFEKSMEHAKRLFKIMGVETDEIVETVRDLRMFM